MSVAKNVLGGRLALCCRNPVTGFFRTGYCDTCPDDLGSHTVCAVMTEQFLAFSRARGNDLSTPAPHFQFPGLKAGDKWCLCAARWLEAHEAGMAPAVDLNATHEAALEIIPLELLQQHALHPSQA